MVESLRPQNSAFASRANEKRQFRRVGLDVRLRVTCRKAGTRMAVRGRGNNLSDGGLAAFIPVELVIGECIELDVSLPYATQPLKLRAVVRNRRSFTYGLEFVSITPCQQAAIARTCRALELVQ